MPNMRQMAKRERKTRQYSREEMVQAVGEVRAGRLSVRQAAKRFRVPRSSLCDRVNGKVNPYCHSGRKPFFSPEDENSLVDHCLYSSSHGSPLTKAQVVAHALAIYNLRHPENPKTSLGQTWLINFWERNRCRLTVRTPSVIEHGRSVCTRTGSACIQDYFQLLATTLEERGLRESPHQIYTCDEAAFQLDSGKVIRKKGKKHAHKDAAQGQSELITVLACFNAAGEDVPPFIIYKERYPWGPYRKDGVPNAFYEKSPAGNLDMILFKTWFVQHFLTHARKERPLVLIFDGHQSHLDPEFVVAAQMQGVILLSLPPHTSHILQPLDVSFFAPLRADFSGPDGDLSAVSSMVSKKEFAKVLRGSYQRLKGQKVVVGGFRKCGLYPLDPTVIDCSQVTRSRLQHGTSTAQDASPLPPASPSAHPAAEPPQLPVCKEEVPRLPVCKEEVLLLPVCKEEVLRLPVCKEEVPQLPVCKEEVPRLPVCKEEVLQIPVCKEEVPRLPVCKEEVLQLPVCKEEVLQLPVCKEEVLRLPVCKEEVLRLPVCKEEVLQLPVCKEEVLQLPVCKEEVPPEQQHNEQDMSRSLVQEDTEPPQIKEEQEEHWISLAGDQLQGLEEADTKDNSLSTIMITCVRSLCSDRDQNQPPHLNQSAKNGEEDPSASISIEQVKTGADTEGCGALRPTSDCLSFSADRPAALDKDSDCECTDSGGSQSGVKTRNSGHIHVTCQNSPHTRRRLYHCSVCEKVFHRMANLKHHMCSHTGEKPHTCIVCGDTFKSWEMLKDHMPAHTGERPFYCSSCNNKFFKVATDVKAHMRTQPGDKGLSYASKLKVHTKKPFQCPICHQGLSSRKSLKGHMRIHSKEKPLSCVICGHSFIQFYRKSEDTQEDSHCETEGIVPLFESQDSCDDSQGRVTLSVR